MNHMEAFQGKNIPLVIIGNGATRFMEAFRKNTGYEGPLYTDTSLKAYEALGFKKSIGSLFGTKTVKEMMKATCAGIFPKGIKGAPTQQGGALVAGPGDKLGYIYRSKEAGDHPPVEEVLAACET